MVDSMKSPPDAIIGLNIHNCNFTMNDAKKAGGAIYWNYLPPASMEKNFFKANSAPYGADIGTYPVALVILHPPTDAKTKDSSYRSAEDFFQSNQYIWTKPCKFALLFSP